MTTAPAVPADAPKARRHARTHAPEAPAPTPSAATRDPFFDVLRAGALLRVVAWHAVAAAWLSWAFAAMPAMFFVAGAMVAQSMARAPHRTVLLSRARRMLPALWLYGVVVAAISLHRPADEGSISWPAALWGAVRWLVPVTDPPGSNWQSGWLTSHLWYLRGYTWLVLLAPLVVAGARRLRFSVPLLAGGVALVELAYRFQVTPLSSGWVRVALGDLTCFGLFAVLGAAWHLRPPATPPTRRVRGAMVASGLLLLAASVLVAVLLGLPSRVANDSYPVLTLLGGGWLALVLAARAPIGAVVGRRLVARAVAVLNRRAVSVYLWHPVAILGALAVLPGSALPVQLARLALVGVGTAVAVAATGWVEDIARARRGERRSNPVPGAVAGLRRLAAVHRPATPWLAAPRALPVLIAVALATPGWLAPATGAGAARQLPAPSDREALADNDFAGRAPLGGVTPGELRLDRVELERRLQAWVKDRKDIDGAQAALSLEDRFIAASAVSTDEVTLAPNDSFSARSVTKMFTGTLILQLAHEGRIDLDAPVPPLPGVMPTPAPVTPRMLLQHASGLENYPDVEAYDIDRTYSPTEAVSLSTTAPLRFAPGTGVYYSNSNFLWLGLLAEHVTGQTYAELVHERIVVPLGLGHSDMGPLGEPGWTYYSSGGLVSSPIDLVRFSDALFKRGDVVPPELLAEMIDVDVNNVGLAAWPLCPCGTDENGHKQYLAIGHTAAWGGLYYYPTHQMSVLVRVEPPPADIAPVYDDLLQRLFET